MTSLSWWSTATSTQRLAQIDGGIECGMTAGQVATNCGVDAGTLRTFADRRGRHFKHDGWHSSGHVRRRSVEAARQAYLAGEPAEAWGGV